MVKWPLSKWVSSYCHVINLYDLLRFTKTVHPSLHGSIQLQKCIDLKENIQIHSIYLLARRRLVQWWGCHLEALRQAWYCICSVYGGMIIHHYLFSEARSFKDVSPRGGEARNRVGLVLKARHTNFIYLRFSGKNSLSTYVDSGRFNFITYWHKIANQFIRLLFILGDQRLSKRNCWFARNTLQIACNASRQHQLIPFPR